MERPLLQGEEGGEKQGSSIGVTLALEKRGRARWWGGNRDGHGQRAGVGVGG